MAVSFLPHGGSRRGRRRRTGAGQGDESPMTPAKLASIHGGPWRDILALARRIEPDPAAVWTWFVGTPIRPYGKTACRLVQAGRADTVLAFLRRALRDIRADAADRAAPAGGEPAMRSLSVW